MGNEHGLVEVRDWVFTAMAVERAKELDGCR